MADKLRCDWCKKKSPENEISSWKQTHHLGIQRICRTCSRNNRRKYRSTAKGRDVENKASKQAYQKHRHKWIARAKIRYVVKIGVIKKPKKCEVCKKVKPTQGHHKDYNKPLEVIWLCTSCHANTHAKLKSLCPNQ